MINWPSQEHELRAEIDRLRAELVELRPYCETLNRRLMEAGDELKRLRTENAQLRDLAEKLADAASGFNVSGVYFNEDSDNAALIKAVYAKTTKEGE